MKSIYSELLSSSSNSSVDGSSVSSGATNAHAGTRTVVASHSPDRLLASSQQKIVAQVQNQSRSKNVLSSSVTGSYAMQKGGHRTNDEDSIASEDSFSDDSAVKETMKESSTSFLSKNTKEVQIQRTFASKQDNQDSDALSSDEEYFRKSASAETMLTNRKLQKGVAQTLNTSLVRRKRPAASLISSSTNFKGSSDELKGQDLAERPPFIPKTSPRRKISNQNFEPWSDSEESSGVNSSEKVSENVPNRQVAETLPKHTTASKRRRTTSSPPIRAPTEDDIMPVDLPEEEQFVEDGTGSLPAHANTRVFAMNSMRTQMVSVRSVHIDKLKQMGNRKEANQLRLSAEGRVETILRRVRERLRSTKLPRKYFRSEDSCVENLEMVNSQQEEENTSARETLERLRNKNEALRKQLKLEENEVTLLQRTEGAAQQQVKGIHPLVAGICIREATKKLSKKKPSGRYRRAPPGTMARLLEKMAGV